MQKKWIFNSKAKKPIFFNNFGPVSSSRKKKKSGHTLNIFILQFCGPLGILNQNIWLQHPASFAVF